MTEATVNLDAPLSDGPSGQASDAVATELIPGAQIRTAGRTITEADLASFAALTWDRHPLHTDAVWAARSDFGERIAHGMLLLSYAVGLLPLDPDRVLALRGLERVAFKRPVRIGDTIRVLARVEEARPAGAEVDLVSLDWKIVNQRQQVVALARANLLWRSGAAMAAGAGEADLNRVDDLPML